MEVLRWIRACWLYIRGLNDTKNVDGWGSDGWKKEFRRFEEGERQWAVVCTKMGMGMDKIGE